MDDDLRARLRDDEDRERFAIRREERDMAAEDVELEDELEVFEEDVRRAEQAIDRDLREEHWGRDPERLPFWRRRRRRDRPRRGRDGGDQRAGGR
ncbi:MAG TPA: hypothetical protein VLA98_05675 [Solirubrobacteraceae bacterium]|nr:hypothetical protein [Solirubrobacteraceae bacterium]HSD81203.1 hypothetical protein [Solirubrobacteraceae bacterium]